MFHNYLKTAFRNLWKNRLYSFINIGGLALGLAVALLILLYVRHELSYDRWVPDQENVYRVYRQWREGAGVIWTPDPLAEALAADLPEVAQAAGLSQYGEALLDYENNKLYVEDVAMVDSTFLDAVALPLVYGNPREALRPPDAVLISQRLAGIFFGPVDPVGKTIRFNGEDDLTVTGVLAPPPGNTHLDYEVYTRFTWQTPNWTGNNRATYVRLRPLTAPGPLEEKMTAYVNTFLARGMRELGMEPDLERLPRWRLQPLADIHLHSASFSWAGKAEGDIKYVYIFLAVALVVLLIASINYINLSTARAVARAREVGVRKAAGARRGQLVVQFLAETMVQAALALVLAVALAEAFLPAFNGIIDRQLAFLQSGEWARQILPLMGLTLVVGLLAGAYPAFVLSAFQPVRVLKGLLPQSSGGQAFRRVLVVAQFAMSVVLVIVILFISKQVNFMMNRELGFAGEQVMAIPLNTGDSHRRVEQLRNEIMAIPGVRGVSTASRLPGHRLPDWTTDIEGKGNDFDPYVLFTDADYAATLGLEVVAGRYFSRDHPTDSLRAFVVNESFVRDFGIENPIGQKVKFVSEDEYGQIVGVVRDYHYSGLDRPIRPVLIGARHNRWFAAVKVAPADVTATVAAIRRLWERVEPEHPLRYSFLDQDFAQLYDEQRRFGRALLYAAVLAIFVAVLGLFGLATYAAATRTKEIGIRKVLGASVRNISLMLMKDFVRWVFVAGIIAAPLGYLLARRWLRDFAYQTELSALPFLLAILAALLIAALTVSFQAVRAALRNPVESLRSE